MKRLRTVCAFALLLVAGPTWADELKTITGKTITGTLEKISDSEIVLNSGGTSVSTPMAQVLNLSLRPLRGVPYTEKHMEVQLVDESFLRCTKVTFKDKEAHLELTTGVVVKAPPAAVLTVLRDAEEVKLKVQWDKLLRNKKNKDRIFVLKDGDLNPIEGALGAIDEARQTIKFKPDGAAALEPAFEKLQGLQFTRTDVPAEASLCKVHDVDGNNLVASKVKFDGGPLNVTTPFGQKVALETKSVTFLDFNFGRLTYLSDLDAKSPAVALLGGFNPVRKDTNLDGDPIQLQDKLYPKGLSMYAGVELEYNLDGKYKEFKALLGADSRIAEEGQGKVTVTIYCDTAKIKSYEVSTQTPAPIAISVKDVNTLRIVVSGSNFTNFSGHATLANAHVSQ